MNWQKFKPIVLNLEVIGLAVALFIAWWHSREIKTTSNQLKQAEQALSTKIDESNRTMVTMQRSMSTRSLGTFPDFTDEIVSTIKSARHEVIVACDFASYGEFDNVGIGIRQELESKIHIGVPVHLTFLGTDRRLHARAAQFPEDKWSTWMNDPVEKAKIINFLKEHGGNSNQPTYRELSRTLERYDQVVSQQIFRGADVIEVDDDIPLLFWIADGERAVMVVQTYGGTEEFAFWTTDARLITALKSIAVRYRQFPARTPSQRAAQISRLHRP